jgi:hypothetical protein
MTLGVGLALLALLFDLGSRGARVETAHGGSPPSLHLNVRVHESLDPANLEQAREMGKALLESVGIRLDWRECHAGDACAPPGESPAVVVLLLPFANPTLRSGSRRPGPSYPEQSCRSLGFATGDAPDRPPGRAHDRARDRTRVAASTRIVRIDAAGIRPRRRARYAGGASLVHAVGRRDSAVPTRAGSSERVRAPVPSASPARRKATPLNASASNTAATSPVL